MKLTAKALRTTGLMAVLCGGMMMSLTPVAHAQDDEGDEEVLAPRPTRVRLVGSYLTSGSVSSFLGKPILGFGASYDFKEIPAGLPIHLAATLDYLSKSRTKTDASRRSTKVEASYFGVGVSGRVYFLPEDAKLNFYAGGGFALNFPRYIVHVNGTETSADNNVALGFHLFSGMEFDRSFFGEFEYSAPGKSQINAFNAAIGYRF